MRKRNFKTALRWTEAEAREALAAWRESGQDLAAFAAGLGVEVQRLERWQRRLDGRALPAMLPLRVVDDAEVPASRVMTDVRARERVEVVLTNGRSVLVPHYFDADQLARVLSAAESA